ncbi:MAG: hypothetical protein K2Q18_00190 [Bdellovibrionales bacterium]|nr:hypothetical protein [Bdellovibrionales bacterium]
MKKILALACLSFSLFSCGGHGGNNTGSIPEGNALGFCGQVPTSLSSAGFANTNDLQDFYKKFNITLVNEVPLNYQVQFVNELRKIPESYLNFTIKTFYSSEIRVISGNGVGEDPTFTGVTTADGRDWKTVPGAGGGPTYIVANKLYKNHGSFDLVVHEYMHTFDRTRILDTAISSSTEWKNLMGDPNLNRILQLTCGDYCTKNPVEAFAETMAIYYGCGRSNALLKSSPSVISFIQRIEKMVQER